MLGAILCNLYRLEASGPFRGFAPGATSWNPNWATDYGPDVDRAKKAKPEEVQTAIDVLSNRILPEYFEEVQLVVERKPMAYELMKAQDDLMSVMTAYYQFKRWQKKRNKVAAILLLS